MFKTKRPDPVAGEVYRHFKGNLYEIVTIAVHTETSDRLVVYRSVETPGKVFARPIDMFMSDVDRIRYPFIKAKYRFTKVEDEPEMESEECENSKSEIDEPEDIKLNSIEPDNIEQENIEPESAESEDDAKYREDGTLVLDPIVEAILDEKEYTKKIENFQLLRGKCTEEMLTMLAISLDIQLSEGTIDDKYAQILKTLKMHEKYESARLRF